MSNDALRKKATRVYLCCCLLAFVARLVGCVVRPAPPSLHFILPLCTWCPCALHSSLLWLLLFVVYTISSCR